MIPEIPDSTDYPDWTDVAETPDEMDFQEWMEHLVETDFPDSEAATESPEQASDPHPERLD